MDRELFAVGPVLDDVSIKLTIHRDQEEEPVSLLITGSARKRSSPLWSLHYVMDPSWGPRERSTAFGIFMSVATEIQPRDQTSARMVINRELRRQGLPGW